MLETACSVPLTGGTAERLGNFFVAAAIRSREDGGICDMDSGVFTTPGEVGGGASDGEGLGNTRKPEGAFTLMVLLLVDSGKRPFFTRTLEKDKSVY
jgi:hypothetical protein